MLEFFIDNIFVEFGGHFFNKSLALIYEQTVPDLSLYSDEAECMSTFFNNKQNTEVKAINVTF